MWINIRVVGNVKYMKRIQLSKVASRIIWKSCGNIETVGINIRVRGKVYLQIKLYCENIWTVGSTPGWRGGSNIWKEDDEGYLQVKVNFKQWLLRSGCLGIVNGWNIYSMKIKFSRVNIYILGIAIRLVGNAKLGCASANWEEYWVTLFLKYGRASSYQMGTWYTGRSLIVQLNTNFGFILSLKRGK